MQAVPNVGIGGDFDDGIWIASPQKCRVWHDWLDRGHLFDPLYQNNPQPVGPSHMRGGKRLYAMLRSHAPQMLLTKAMWNSLTLVAYRTRMFPSAGDHAAGERHTTINLLQLQASTPMS